MPRIPFITYNSRGHVVEYEDWDTILANAKKHKQLFTRVRTAHVGRSRAERRHG